jgi:hypothetical protein
MKSETGWGPVITAVPGQARAAAWPEMKATVTLEASFLPLYINEFPGASIREKTVFPELVIVTFAEAAVQTVPLQEAQSGMVSAATA